MGNQGRETNCIKIMKQRTKKTMFHLMSMFECQNILPIKKIIPNFSMMNKFRKNDQRYKIKWKNNHRSQARETNCV